MQAMYAQIISMIFLTEVYYTQKFVLLYANKRSDNHKNSGKSRITVPTFE